MDQEFLRQSIWFVFAFGSAFCVILAAGQWLKPGTDAFDRLGGVIYLLVAGVYANLSMDSLLMRYPHLYMVLTPFLYLAAPFSYLYFRRIFRPEQRLSWRSLLLHSLPAIVLALALLPVYAQPAAVKADILKGAFALPDSQDWFVYARIVTASLHLPVPAYMIVLLVEFGSLLRSARPGSVRRTTLIYVGLLCFAFVSIIVSWVTWWSPLIIFGYVLLLCIVIAMYFSGLRHPELLSVLQREAARARYKSTRLGGIDVEDAIGRLEKLMREDVVYADEDLSLASLAQLLSINPHGLSELLNVHMNTTFHRYVNGHRVAAAEHMLREDSKRAILSIAMAVGFNSKSTFNAEFKRFTGRTPREHRSNGD